MRLLTYQEFCDEQVARNSHPETFPTAGANGRLFTKDRAMKCPHCLNTFYGYQPMDAPYPPYTSDPIPSPRDESGVRRTCGHPCCESAEDKERFAERLAIRPVPAKEETKNIKPIVGKPKLMKAGEMGR